MSVGAVAAERLCALAPRVLNSGAQVFQIPTSQAFGASGDTGAHPESGARGNFAGHEDHVWTIDQSDGNGAQLMDSGVDGIVSNRIDVLRRVARERALW